MERSQDWLAIQVSQSPHRLSIISDGQYWTYQDLNLMTARLARRLAENGVQRGQRVAVILPNRVEYIALIFAVQRLGAVLVPLNNRLSPAELLEQYQSLSCSWLITQSEIERTENPTLWEVLSGSILELDDTLIPTTSETSYKTYLSGEIEYKQTSVIVTTSGSTGTPLGVKLSYGNLFWSAYGSTARLGNQDNDRWLACLPLFHVGGLGIVIRSVLNGSAIVLHEGFRIEPVVRDLVDHRVTHLSLVPTMLHRLIRNTTDLREITELRHLLVGGGHLAGPLLDQSVGLGLPIRLTYGMTETASQVATATSTDLTNKPGSVGRPLYFTHVTILREDGRIAETGEHGEIVVQGPTVMQGYAEDPSGKGKILLDDQLMTGDLGSLDKDGDLWVHGRKDEMIKSGGEKVYPFEVEQALLFHPQIREAKVFGIQEEEWGERVVAAVVGDTGSALDQEAITKFLRLQISSFKIPHTIFFLDQLPRTGSGKVDTQKIRRQLEAEYEA